MELLTYSPDTKIPVGVVADLMHVTTQTIVNWTRRGLLKAIYTKGGHRRYLYSEVEEFAKQHREMIEQ